MARGWHYTKLSLSNAPRLSFSGMCILLFLFLSLCRLCLFVFFFCSHWSLVDVPLIFFCPADLVEARSVNVKKTTTTTVQACQQHRLAVMNPNKAKSFPAATMPPAVAKLERRRRVKRGNRSEERRNARRAHASKQQCRRWRSRGVVGLPHPTRRKKGGKNLGRKHLELSERRRAFARKKRRGKRAKRKSVRKKHKAARARSRLEELTFGTFNVRTAAVNGVNDIGYIDNLLRTCAAKGCDVPSDCRRPRGTELRKFRHLSGYRVFLMVIVAWLGAGKDSMGLD